ncbi:hypothetical protein DOY81_001019 [Sarcophaga bullata]|nr:hypothetical protein DOY81_001019 [Sarcophaga bullata]
MLAAVKIKEEPLDDEEIEDLQEVLLKQQETLISRQIDPAFLENTNNHKNLNNFQIVDEQDSIITVSAADMRSEDELKFIDSINNTSTQPSKFRGVCSKCLKQFTNRSQFLKHTKRNHCITKQKCPVCPVTFIDAISLLNHLNLHRENYFFCNHHCGANFQTLPLCEEHEMKEHKTHVAPKIRYKHFCSFCREGFKTELQLHVHWLEQVQGCGKLMQNVVLHSTTVASNNNLNNKNHNSNGLDLQKQLSTTNTVSTVPITKLRLKSCSTTDSTTTTTNKRQITVEPDERETILKRIKLLDKIKADTESNQLPFNYENDIKIKEEPLDEYEGNMNTNLIPEVIIKTEDEEQQTKAQVEHKHQETKVEMKSLIINNMIGPESNGKFIPIENFSLPKSTNIKPLVINNGTKPNINAKLLTVNSNNSPVLKIISNNNNSMNINNSNMALNSDTNLRLVKLTPASIASVNKACNNTTTATFSNAKNTNQINVGKFMTLKLQNTQHNLNGVDVKPLLKNGLQIIKLVPNTHITTLKTANTNNAKANANANVNNKSPLVLKLKTCPTSTANSVSLLTTQQTQTQTPASVTLTKTITASTNTSPTNSSAVSIKLTSINHNTTIDAEDFKKLQAEALIKAEEHRKNFYIPKTRLMIIENIPEKKQLIDNMKQQIAKVETKTEQVSCKTENFILNTKQPDEPATLYLPILTKIDVSLVQARCQNPNYFFKWICPYCQKDYEMKSALKSHLSKAHNLNNRDMEKINVQAKPFKNEPEPQMVVKEEPVHRQDTSDSQTLTSESESITADNITLAKCPKSGQQVKTSNNRYRFVCDKCGRSCSSKTMLNDHILANCSREPQYSCKECNKKFYSHGTLQCHMTIHTGELPHKCSYCDKRFRTRGQVKVHHRTHTGERPFFCQVCSQRFTHRETLIAHLSRHIGMKRYKCYGCDKHFSCISALKTHREIRADTCGKVKFNPRAIGPRVRVIRGNVIFEPQPEINPYLKSEDPKTVLSELQNQAQSKS